LVATNHNDVSVKYDASKPTMIPKRLIEISLAKKRLDWQPKINIKVGIQKTVDWYTSEFSNKSPEDYS